jgi:hypothetical protein
MRLLAKAAGFGIPPIIILLIGLAVAIPGGSGAMLRAMASAGVAARSAMDAIRDRLEPAVYIGGLLVSRSRHVIAGAVMGCSSGAAMGAGGAAAVGLVTGGAGFAAIPLTAGIGCVAGGAMGVALGYPLDAWALE